MKKSLLIAVPVLIASAAVMPAAIASAAPAAPAAPAATAAAAAPASANWIDGVRFSIKNETDKSLTVDGSTLAPGATSQVKSNDDWDGARVTFNVTLPNGKTGVVTAINPMATSARFEANIGGHFSGEMPIGENDTKYTKTDTIGDLTLTSKSGGGWRDMNMAIRTFS